MDVNLDDLKEKMKNLAKERSQMEYNEWWTPQKVGDDLLCLITGARQNPWDEESTLYDVEEIGTGVKYTLRPQKAIVSSLEAQHAEKGKILYICYTGKTKSKQTGMLYNTYEIAVVDSIEDLENEEYSPGVEPTKNTETEEAEVPMVNNLGELVKQVIEFYDGEVEIKDVQEYLLKTGRGSLSEDDIASTAALEGFVVEDGVIRSE